MATLFPFPESKGNKVKPPGHESLKSEKHSQAALAIPSLAGLQPDVYNLHLHNFVA
jgi:hypothetical protein